MDEDKKSKTPWWQTVPGILTAAAAIITAVTGLVVALHQIGLVGGDKVELQRNTELKPPSAESGQVNRNAIGESSANESKVDVKSILHAFQADSG